MSPSTLAQPQYFVVITRTTFESLDAVRDQGPTEMAAQLARSKELHADGTLLIAGASIHEPGTRVYAMRDLVSREAAQDHALNDPSVLGGIVHERTVRPWATQLG